jgi:hypothetical protein
LVNVFSMDAPALSSALPANIAATFGLGLTLSGLSFHHSSHSPTIYLSTFACPTTSWSSATTLTCDLAASAAVLALEAGLNDYRPTVTLRQALWSTAQNLLTFDAPVASQLFASFVNTASSGCLSLAFVGLSFGARDYTPTLRLGPSSVQNYCSTASWTSLSSVACNAQDLEVQVGLPLRVTLQVRQLDGTSLLFPFSFDAPLLSDMSTNLALSGGSTVTIAGTGFGLPSSAIAAQLGADACQTQWVASTSIACRLGPVSLATVRGLRETALTVNSRVGTLTTRLYSFDAPIATRGYPNLVLSGQSALSLSGLSFGNGMLTASASIAARDCMTTSWSAATLLVCRASAADSSVLDTTVKVTVSANVGTSLAAFTFDCATANLVDLALPSF